MNLHKKRHWISGVIVKKLGKMMYVVTLENGQEHRRHQNQIRPNNSSVYTGPNKELIISFDDPHQRLDAANNPNDQDLGFCQ
jgi:hypothetical protein